MCLLNSRTWQSVWPSSIELRLVAIVVLKTLFEVWLIQELMLIIRTSSTKQVLLGSFILIYPILYNICRVREKKKYKNHIGEWQSTGFELEQYAFADWFIRNSYVSCHSTSVIFSFESIQLFCCCLLTAEQYVFFSANSLLLWLNARCVSKLSAWRVMVSGRVDSECVNKYCRHQAIVILKQFFPFALVKDCSCPPPLRPECKW